MMKASPRSEAQEAMAIVSEAIRRLTWVDAPQAAKVAMLQSVVDQATACMLHLDPNDHSSMPPIDK